MTLRGHASSLDRPASAPLGRRAALLLSWMLILALVGGGAALLAVAANRGAPPWLLAVFLAAGVVGCLAHYLFVARDDAPRPWWTAPESLRAFGELGAGDLPRATAFATRLPGALGDAFARASDSLAAFARELQDGSLRLAGATERVEGIASELASGAAQQSASVVQITTAMEELARTATQIAESASAQTDLASRADESGRAGEGAAEAALAGLDELQRQIAMMSHRAETLGTRAKEVFRVVDLINEIALETHILSLNAAIEAEGSGARGRRFSVVADEVRRLAQQTRESVASVRGLLDELGAAIRSVVIATEEGGKEVGRVLERARSGAQAIAELRGTTARTVGIASEISAVTRQQNAATEEALTTLRDLSRVIQGMSRDLQDLKGTAKRLNRIGAEKQLAAQTFHVESPRSVKRLAYQWLEKLRETSDSERPAVLRSLMEAAPFAQLGFVHDGVGRSVLSFARDPASGALTELDGVGISVVERDWYRALRHERRACVSSAYRSLIGGELCFTVAAPWIDSDGRLVAAVGFDVNAAVWARI